MNNSSAPIGVFDSGVGGLTVLSTLQKMFPQENFIYLADGAYCPYGTKSPKEVSSRVMAIGNEMINRGVKAIIIACNTATANAKAFIDSASIPVIGVIEPTAIRAAEVSKTKKVLLLATDLTVKLQAYNPYLQGITVTSLGSSVFVPLAESPDRDSIETAELVKSHLAKLPHHEFDTIIYGCTHFGLLDKAIQKALPGKKIVECGEPTGAYLASILSCSKMENDHMVGGTTTLYTTGNVTDFKKQISWYDGTFIGPYQW